ncbi:hypothetical protein IG631_11656 [Alternaria alternata]|nr:hypothetical protein IG631_11656 [Alternaria alternata]
MSETYRQQAFGQPTFTDGHASGSSSGHDLFDILDAANLYHDHEYHPGGQHLQPLQIPTQNDIAQNQHFAYALHASGVSAPGPFAACGRNSRVSELSGLDDVCSGWNGVLSLAARDQSRRRDLRRLHTRLGRCVCKLCTDACCCIEGFHRSNTQRSPRILCCFLFPAYYGH